MNTSSLNDILDFNSSLEQSFTLKGLLKGGIGMLIAAPNIGKSHLALCIAIEHASSSTLLGLSASSIGKNTIVLSSEDGAAVLKERMSKKLAQLPISVKKELDSNLSFMTDLEPLVIPPESSAQRKKEHDAYITDLIDTLSHYDLAIIDTVTEAIGECEEVKHDRLIKNALQHIAKQSGCSLLLVHHVNKDEIRGTQEITMASGAGLTSIMRLTKFLMTLQKKKGVLSLKYLKSNYLSTGESQDIVLEIRDNLTIDPQVFTVKSFSGAKVKRQTAAIKEEPTRITLSGVPPETEEIKDRQSLRDVL